MTKIEVVQTINSELHALKAEAMAQGDSPRVKALIAILIRLTEPFNEGAVPAPACKHEKIEQGICLQCGGVIPSLQTGEPAAPVPEGCPHKNINPYGVCRDCNTCLHQFRNAYGICNQCGEQAQLEPEPAALADTAAAAAAAHVAAVSDDVADSLEQPDASI